MGYIPCVDIGLSLDGETYLLIHMAPAKGLPGYAATPVGDIERVPRAEFEKACKALLLTSMDAYIERIAPRPGEYERLGPKGQRALHRATRIVSVQLGSPWASGDVAEFAPNHLRSNGALEGCNPGDRVRVQRDESNEAFLRALYIAFSRCRGYPAMPPRP